MLNDKLRILIVDDSKDFSTILNDYLMMFKKDGLEVIGMADNGLTAFDMIISEQPDIVLLDIVMPNLDGFGVLEKINSINNWSRPSVIILSALGDINKIQKALDLGADFYFEKPFDLNVLVKKLIDLKNNAKQKLLILAL